MSPVPVINDLWFYFYGCLFVIEIIFLLKILTSVFLALQDTQIQYPDSDYDIDKNMYAKKIKFYKKNLKKKI